jgi:hypothetical protein
MQASMKNIFLGSLLLISLTGFTQEKKEILPKGWRLIKANSWLDNVYANGTDTIHQYYLCNNNKCDGWDKKDWNSFAVKQFCTDCKPEGNVLTETRTDGQTTSYTAISANGMKIILWTRNKTSAFNTMSKWILNHAQKHADDVLTDSNGKPR